MNNPALTWLLLTAALAGCAAQPGPAPRPQPPVDTVPVEERAPPRPVPDTQAPTLALVRQSEHSADAGDLESAIAYVERAIRLDSHNADLWLRLAGLQLAARRPGTAEQLAHKAIALADDTDQQRRGWLLVADALDAQGKDGAAADIRARWRTWRG